jgi:hypothetical protein
LQQTALWPLWAYAALVLPGGLLAVALWIRRGLPLHGTSREVAWLVAAACLGFVGTGGRGVAFEN